MLLSEYFFTKFFTFLYFSNSSLYILSSSKYFIELLFILFLLPSKSVNFGPGAEMLMNPKREKSAQSPRTDINISDLGELDSLDLNETKLNIEEYMNYVDIKHLKSSYPNTLSHGEKQRVAMLRCLLGGKKIILADEPTGNLDEINTKLLLELILNINRKLEYTFVITSHDMNFMEIANNVYTIMNKKIIKNNE